MAMWSFSIFLFFLSSPRNLFIFHISVHLVFLCNACLVFFVFFHVCMVWLWISLICSLLQSSFGCFFLIYVFFFFQKLKRRRWDLVVNPLLSSIIQHIHGVRTKFWFGWYYNILCFPLVSLLVLSLVLVCGAFMCMKKTFFIYFDRILNEFLLVKDDL